MVVLKDLFNLLAAGEFANIALSRDSTGNIKESEYPAVAGHLNLGILEIYKRFKLLQGEVLLHVNPAVEKYYLREERMTSLNNINTQFYIERPEETDGCLNMIEVTAVFDADGDELIMNNRFKTPSIQQLATDILKITNLTTPQILSVEFQSYPSKITIEDDFNPEEYALFIPDTIVEPLLYYVASRVYKPTGKNDSTANADKSASYEQKYELACQKINLYGLDIQGDDTCNNFESEGWT
jgi:hypothetical protein